MRGTTLAIAILSAIGSLKTFDIPYLITGGGPSYSTEFLGTLIYRVSVAFSKVGYGAAISIVLLVLAMGAAIIINTGGRRRKLPCLRPARIRYGILLQILLTILVIPFVFPLVAMIRDPWPAQAGTTT